MEIPSVKISLALYLTAKPLEGKGKCCNVPRSLAEFATAVANKIKSIFCRGVYPAENTSQLVSVEFVRGMRTNYARSKLQPTRKSVLHFFEVRKWQRPTEKPSASAIEERRREKVEHAEVCVPPFIPAQRPEERHGDHLLSILHSGMKKSSIPQ